MISGYTAVQLFSATMAQDRARLGEKVSDWIANKPGVDIVETVIRQSSDDAFHCLSITLFYNEPSD